MGHSIETMKTTNGASAALTIKRLLKADNEFAFAVRYYKIYFIWGMNYFEVCSIEEIDPDEKYG